MPLSERHPPPQRRGGANWIQIVALLGAFSAWAMVPALAVSPAPPQPVGYLTPSATAGALWRECGSSTTGPPPKGCSAYVAGVADGAQRSAARGFCLPGDVDADQLAAAVRRRLAADPTSHAAPAAVVVMASLQHDFPCGPAGPHA